MSIVSTYGYDLVWHVDELQLILDRAGDFFGHFKEFLPLN